MENKTEMIKYGDEIEGFCSLEDKIYTTILTPSNEDNLNTCNHSEPFFYSYDDYGKEVFASYCESCECTIVLKN